MLSFSTELSDMIRNSSGTMHFFSIKCRMDGCQLPLHLCLDIKLSANFNGVEMKEFASHPSLDLDSGLNILDVFCSSFRAN